MNIIIDKNLLLQPLSKLVNITERRSIMPILSNILLNFSKEEITISSTDLEISAVSRVNYPSDLETRAVVHGRKFMEILKEMDQGEIHLGFNDSTLTIKQKNSEFVLSLHDPEEFPEVKEVEGGEEFSMGGSDFLEILEKVSFAVSSDETRYVLTGMYMAGNGGRVSVVGTDGFRMALYQKEVQGLGDFKGVIVPKRSILEVGRVVSEDEVVKFMIGEKHIQFSTPSITVISRLIEGSFPDYQNVIPKTNSNIAKIEKARFVKGLRKVSTIISKSEPIKVTYDNGTMEIETESEIGRAKEVVDASYEGEVLSMNFNIRFVMDVVSHIEGEWIFVKAPSTYGAVLFVGGDEENYKNIVMPIRV
jgi:DNA polymerase III subunit beta